MNWFNYYGLIAIILIMLPNIIYFAKKKNVVQNENKSFLLVLEQIGRYGCMGFMVFNIPYTYYGFWFNHGLLVYLIVGGVILLLYELGWILKDDKKIFKALWLSIIPFILFLFCGICIRSILLITCSIIFGVSHITISYQNAIR